VNVERTFKIELTDEDVWEIRTLQSNAAFTISKRMIGDWRRTQEDRDVEHQLAVLSKIMRSIDGALLRERGR